MERSKCRRQPNCEFPSGYVLKAGATAKSQPPTYLKWTGSYIWNNNGDSAKLINIAGIFYCECYYYRTIHKEKLGEEFLWEY